MWRVKASSRSLVGVKETSFFQGSPLPCQVYSLLRNLADWPICQDIRGFKLSLGSQLNLGSMSLRLRTARAKGGSREGTIGLQPKDVSRVKKTDPIHGGPGRRGANSPCSGLGMGQQCFLGRVDGSWKQPEVIGVAPAGGGGAPWRYAPRRWPHKNPIGFCYLRLSFPLNNNILRQINELPYLNIKHVD